MNYQDYAKSIVVLHSGKRLHIYFQKRMTFSKFGPSTFWDATLKERHITLYLGTRYLSINIKHGSNLR